MNDDLATLLRLAAPPEHELPPVDWPAVERDLGFALPSTYRAVAERYGPGRFGGVQIASPAARDPDNDLRTRVPEEAENLAANRGDAGRRWMLPYPVEPVEGGLVAFAKSPSDSGVRGAYWLRRGDAESWPVVLIEGALYPEGWLYEGTTAAFLVAVLRRELEVPFARATFFDPPTFRPLLTELERLPKPPGRVSRLLRRR